MLRWKSWGVLVSLLVLASLGRTADGQVPSPAYYSGLQKFYDGQYHDAARMFSSAARGAFKTAQSRWIDSICYETMWGECFYQTGDLDTAKEHYTAALDLLKQYPEWLTSVRFESTIRPAPPSARKLVPWGASKRQTVLGYFPPSTPIVFGQGALITSQYIVPQTTMQTINVQEIVRCTTLALRRRAMVLGPVSRYDPLSSELASVLNRAIAPANHWSQCWADLERALALIAAGREAQAGGLLRQAVLAGGEFDHPLTSVALLELGRQSLLRGDYPAAASYFEEATYSAVNYPDCGVLEDAFRNLMVTRLIANNRSYSAPIDEAIGWAKQNRLRQLQASLLLSAAENHAVLGQTAQAAAMLEEARQIIGARSKAGGMATGVAGGRLSYLMALVAYQQGRLPQGNADMASTLGYLQRSSLWLYQIAAAEHISGTLTSAGCRELYAEVLRDPRPADWLLDPMESLAFLATPNRSAFDNWFEAAAGHEAKEALYVAERARRHRFFSSMGFGARLESLRWIFEAPRDRLSHEAVLQRQDMLTRYPHYDQLSQQAQAMRASLAKLPLVAEDPAALKEQTRAFGELQAASQKQETMLREIALRREPAELVFPPLRPVADIQKSLAGKQAVLAFYATSRRLYGFLIDNQRCTAWQVLEPTRLLVQIKNALRDMGQRGATVRLPAKELTDVKWKRSAAAVLDRLLKGSQADFSHPFDELAIVPDGALWYVPFEALQVTVAGKQQPLIAQARVRYAPTVALAVPQGGQRSTGGNTVVIADKTRGDRQDETDEAFEQLAAVVPDAVMLKSPPPAPSAIYRVLFRRLIVLDELAAVSDQDPYAWRPAPSERGKAGGTLGDWLMLPWGGPEVMLLPGFHTAAEDGLRKPRRTPPGSEMFLTVCGLMAGGARTLVLSRWRTNGQSSFDLVREFTQELPTASAADAWQRAVTLASESRLNLDAEPRIEHTAIDEVPKASHPFFWAGCMLVDSGSLPPKSEARPPAAVKQPPKPGKRG